MNVKNYFDDDEKDDDQPTKCVRLKNLNESDYSGKRFNGWLIISAVDKEKNIYKVVCSCGKEFVRNIYHIVSYKVNQCKFCYRKKTFFNLM